MKEAKSLKTSVKERVTQSLFCNLLRLNDLKKAQNSQIFDRRSTC